ncbi:MAG: hypothetical protein R3F36_07215 [Candidatus Competibacteraceae bacterium]
MLAAMWLLVIEAGLADTPPISRTWLRVLLVTGPLVFHRDRLRGLHHCGNGPRLSGGAMRNR